MGTKRTCRSNGMMAGQSGGDDVQTLENTMERVTTKQAAKELNMDVEAVTYLMRNNRLPIGYVIKKEGKTRHAYYIYRGLLDTYKRQMQGG